MRYFDKKLLANSALHAEWWSDISFQRSFFMNSEIALANAAPLTLPDAAWLELDTETTRVMRDDEGQEFMRDLMPLARPVDIGVTVLVNRIVGDSGIVVRSMSGQVPTPLENGVIDYDGTPIPVFSGGYGRAWREFATIRNANFNPLLDDHENTVAAVQRDMADYTLTGDMRMSVSGYKGFGIMNHPNSKVINLGSAAGGANIDLTNNALTADVIETFFSSTLGAMLDANSVTDKVNIYVSPEIGRNLDRSYSGAGGFKDGTIWTQLLKNRRIGKLAVTSMLSGNQFMGFVPNGRFIKPLVGMAVNTMPKVRINPRDNYQWEVAGAQGIQITRTANGKSGVFRSAVLN